MKNYLIKRSVCLFCSLGCGVAFRTEGEQVTAIDYDKDNPVNRGSLCSRGYYNLELLNHPQRLIEPQIGERKVSWEEALSFVKRGIKEFKPEEIGIIVSCRASNEDASAAAKLAKALGTKNISPAGEPSDLEAYQRCQREAPGAKLEDIENSESLLIIGDLLVRTPVLARRINQAKYGKRAKITVVDPDRTHTSWFAASHLTTEPAAAPFAGTVLFAPRPGAAGNDLAAYFSKVLANLSPGGKYLIFYSYGNTLGVNTVLDQETEGHIAFSEMLEKVEKGEIKAMFMLGEDISALHPKIRLLKFAIVSNYFRGDLLLDETRVLLPRASHLEGGGSFVLSDGRVEAPEPVAPRVGAKTEKQWLSEYI